MKRLFLASQFSEVAQKFADIVPISGMRVAVITTAGKPYEKTPWIEKDTVALSALGYEPFAYDIEGKTKDAVYADLRDADIVFVAGGNTFYLLRAVRASGFDQVLPQLLEEGAWYIGSSAGSVLVGPTLAPIHSLDDAGVAEGLLSEEGLGYISNVILPHYNSEKYKAAIDAVIASWKGEAELMTLCDDQALVVTEDGERLV